MLKIASAYIRYRIFIGVYGHYMVTKLKQEYVLNFINVVTVGVSEVCKVFSTEYYESTALTKLSYRPFV